MISFGWSRSSSGVAPASTKDSSPKPQPSSPPAPLIPPLPKPESASQSSLVAVFDAVIDSNPARIALTDDCLDTYDVRTAPCVHMLPYFVVRVLVREGETDPVLSSWLALVGIEPNPGPVHAKKATTPHKAKEVVVVMPPRQGKKKKSKEPRITPRAVGSALGGWVGDMAAKAIRAITGFGDYTVQHNSMVNANQIPQFKPNSRSSFFRRREFVGLVSSPGAVFTTTQFIINPLTSFFPWLSEIAGSFEQFIVHGMIVEFKSTSATAVSSTNTALGSVILATQYNVLAPSFSSQQQMEAYDYVTSTCPSTDMIHPIECAPGSLSVRELYVDINYGGDPRLGMLGITTIATVGQQAASTIGELWVSYDIEMIRPKLLGGIPTTGMSYSAQPTSGGNTTYGNFQQFVAPYPIGSLPNGSDIDVGWPITGYSGGVPIYNALSFPFGMTGAYLCSLSMIGVLSGSTGTFGGFSVSNGASISNFFGPSGSPRTAAFSLTPVGVASTQLEFKFIVVLGGPMPIYGGLTSSPVNNQRPTITVPQLTGNDGSSLIRLLITPISFFG